MSSCGKVMALMSWRWYYGTTITGMQHYIIFQEFATPSLLLRHIERCTMLFCCLSTCVWFSISAIYKLVYSMPRRDKTYSHNKSKCQFCKAHQVQDCIQVAGQHSGCRVTCGRLCTKWLPCCILATIAMNEIQHANVSWHLHSPLLGSAIEQ